MAGSIRDWPSLFREAYRVLKPGGWIESGEFDPRFLCDDGSADDREVVKTWNKIFEEGGKAVGSSFTVIDDDVQELGIREAGFGDVQGLTLKVNVPSRHILEKQWNSNVVDCRHRLVRGRRIRSLQRRAALCSYR